MALLETPSQLPGSCHPQWAQTGDTRDKGILHEGLLSSAPSAETEAAPHRASLTSAPTQTPGSIIAVMAAANSKSAKPAVGLTDNVGDDGGVCPAARELSTPFPDLSAIQPDVDSCSLHAPAHPLPPDVSHLGEAVVSALSAAPGRQGERDGTSQEQGSCPSSVSDASSESVSHTKVMPKKHRYAYLSLSTRMATDLLPKPPSKGSPPRFHTDCVSFRQQSSLEPDLN